MQHLSEKEAWQERWQSGRTGWDQGGAHPSLPLLVFHARREGALPDSARFYSAGVGRAHNEACLAEMGYHVHAVDLSVEAITQAKASYGHLPNLQLETADIFHIPEGEQEAFDAIFDRAMLCALSPEVQPHYIAAIHKRLKAGGLFCSILFRRVKVENPPPYEVDEATAFKLLGKDFHLSYAAAVEAAPSPQAVKEEWICVWRKKTETAS